MFHPIRLIPPEGICISGVGLAFWRYLPEWSLTAMQRSPVWFLGKSAGEGIGCPLQYSWASLMAQLVKNPPAMWETRVRSLGWEDPLEEGKATHSRSAVLVLAAGAGQSQGMGVGRVTGSGAPTQSLDTVWLAQRVNEGGEDTRRGTMRAPQAWLQTATVTRNTLRWKFCFKWPQVQTFSG